MIYFIQINDNNGPIKIGLTNNPQKRLREIQTTCPTPVILLKAIEGEWEKEQLIHSHFSHLRLHGEWFTADKELLDFIENPYEIKRTEKIKQPTKPIPAPPTNLFNDYYPQLLTPEQAAAILSLSPVIIRRYCRQGRLGQHIGGRWLITRDDLEQFNEQPRKVGNPNFKHNKI